MKHEDRHKRFGTPKGKDLSVFVRFGGANLKPQKGYGNDTFHSPPAPRGIYAMPKVVQVFFLVGSIGKFQPGTMPKEKSRDEIEKMTHEEAHEYWSAQEPFMKRIRMFRKEFRKTDGNIWHHLGQFVPRNEVIAEHGSWVKTSIKTWQKAFSKHSIQNRYGEDGIVRRTSIDQARGINGYYNEDHFEVFFDEKI